MDTDKDTQTEFKNDKISYHSKSKCFSYTAMKNVHTFFGHNIAIKNNFPI